MRDVNIVIVGHVDHGKSTVIGRLLADTDSLPQGKLEQVQEMCRRNSKPFEYAFLLDALKDERSQGITIDAARCFFKTKMSRYMILDAPGHIEFLKNMITGASKAQAALLVIDVNEGIKENTKRHAYMLSLLGIKQVAVLVNKMDLVGYSESAFDSTVSEFEVFLQKINMHVEKFIPVSAVNGDNVVTKSQQMSWYSSETAIDVLENFEREKSLSEKPFRMFVQDIYKFTLNKDNRRIVAGTVETGTLSVGDRVVFYPSGKTSTVKTFESFNTAFKDVVYPSEAVGFTLDEQIYIKRGELAVRQGEQKPSITNCFKANIFWLGKSTLSKGRQYFLKIGTLKTEVLVEDIVTILDTSTLEQCEKNSVEFNEVASCVFKTTKPIAFDLFTDMYNTGRFVLVDEYDIVGGGLITENIKSEYQSTISEVVEREYKWEKSSISYEDRAERYSQKPAVVLITGDKKYDKKSIAKLLEARLFSKGRFVYYLGIGSIVKGLNYDVVGDDQPTNEHMRRLAELANVMLDAGMILIVSASDVVNNDLEIFKSLISNGQVYTVCLLNKNDNVNLKCDININSEKPLLESVIRVEKALKENNVLFNIAF